MPFWAPCHWVVSTRRLHARAPQRIQKNKIYNPLWTKIWHWLITLLPLKVLVPWVLGFFTYSSIKEYFTSIVGLEGNRSYNCQSFQLRNNGFWIWRGLATANPSKISLSQFWTMSTFYMVRALLTETMFHTS
jgi:hypothetical protein